MLVYDPFQHYLIKFKQLILHFLIMDTNFGFTSIN